MDKQDHDKLVYQLSDEDPQEGYEALVKALGDEPGVFFAGEIYEDPIIEELHITIRVGDQVATDTIFDRDIDKFKEQARYYSKGNVAQFILDVFNRFVDRYEAERPD